MSIGALPPVPPVQRSQEGSSGDNFKIFDFSDPERQALQLANYPIAHQYDRRSFSEFLSTMEMPNQMNILDRLVVITHMNSFTDLFDELPQRAVEMYKGLMINETIAKLSPRDLQLQARDFYKILLANFFIQASSIPDKELGLIYRALTKKIFEENRRSDVNFKNELENYFIGVAGRSTAKFGSAIADFFGSWDQRVEEFNQGQGTVAIANDESTGNTGLVFQARQQEDDDIDIVSNSLVDIIKPTAKGLLWEDPLAAIIEEQRDSDGLFLYDGRVDRNSSKSMENLWEFYKNTLTSLNNEGYTRAVIDITDITKALMTHHDANHKRTTPIELTAKIQEHINDTQTSESTSQALSLGSNLPPAISFAARCVDMLQAVQRHTNIDIWTQTAEAGRIEPARLRELIESNETGKTVVLGSFAIAAKNRKLSRIDNFYTTDIHSVNKGSEAYLAEARGIYSMLQAFTGDETRLNIFVIPGILEYCARSCFDSRIWQDQIVGFKGQTNPELVKFLEYELPEMPHSYVFICSKDPNDGSDEQITAGAPVDSDQLVPSTGNQ